MEQEKKEKTSEQIAEEKLQMEKGGRAHILELVVRMVQIGQLKPVEVPEICKMYVEYIETGVVPTTEKSE